MRVSKKCLICNKGKKNDTLYWHRDEDSGDIWVWCNKCQRGYSLHSYCHIAGVDLAQFLKGDFDFVSDSPNELRVVSWPSTFVPLIDRRAEKGIEYLKKRGLTLDADVYYDIEEEGLVFPYYFEDHFCGAQIRFLQERVKEDGDTWKITTMPGTRLGLLFGLWNQKAFVTDIKAIVVCEGYINALSLQQAFNSIYGGIHTNPWKFICASGSGLSQHQAEALKELKEKGYKVVCAADSDEGGLKMLSKMKDLEVITHYSLTQDNELDWNDFLIKEGRKNLTKLFLSNLRKADE
jgi:hypothetical protein